MESFEELQAINKEGRAISKEATKAMWNGYRKKMWRKVIILLLWWLFYDLAVVFLGELIGEFMEDTLHSIVMMIFF
jgi:hypothetical protein